MIPDSNYSTHTYTHQKKQNKNKTPKQTSPKNTDEVIMQL